MHIRSLGVALFISALAVGTSGCPAEPVGNTPCDGDSDCPMGQYCESGVGCTFDCRTDVDCTGMGGNCSSRGRCEADATDAGPRDGALPTDAASDDCRTAADCNDSMFCNGPETCDSSSAAADDRGCVPGTPPCVAGATCEEATDTCTTNCDSDEDGNGRIDADNDGDAHRSLACAGDDCDDDDADRFPRGGAEICDPAAPAHDEDCNPCTIASFIGADGDRDGDRYLSGDCTNPIPVGTSPATLDCPVAIDPYVFIDVGAALVTGTDCNDDATAGVDVHPTAPEVCNGVDDNCVDGIDEGVMPRWYADLDGDGYGNVAGGTSDECEQPEGFAPTNDDCNDTPVVGTAVHPGAREICDVARVDEDCDMTPNEDCTCDVDGPEMTCSSGFPGCPDGIQPCIMDSPSGSHYGMCTASMGTRSCWNDADRDGYAPSGALETMACVCPAGTTPTRPVGADIDCLDSGSLMGVSAGVIYPRRAEACNAVDDDCNGTIDDVPGVAPADRCIYGSAARTCADPSCAGATGYQDCTSCAWTGRGVGVGVCRRDAWECTAGSGRGCTYVGGAYGRDGTPTCSGTDPCSSSCRYTGCAPMGTETCNFIDDNCNGALDEGLGACCGWQWTWTTCGPGGLGDDTHDCEGCSFAGGCYPDFPASGGYYRLSTQVRWSTVMNYDIGAFTTATVAQWGAVISGGGSRGPDEFGIPTGPGLAVIWNHAAGRLEVYELIGSSASLVRYQACSRRSGDVAMNVSILGDYVVAGVGPTMRSRGWCEITATIPNLMRDNMGEFRYFGSVGAGGNMDHGNVWLTRGGFAGSGGACDTSTYCGACF